MGHGETTSKTPLRLNNVWWRKKYDNEVNQCIYEYSAARYYEEGIMKWTQWHKSSGSEPQPLDEQKKTHTNKQQRSEQRKSSASPAPTTQVDENPVRPVTETMEQIPSPSAKPPSVVSIPRVNAHRAKQKPKREPRSPPADEIKGKKERMRSAWCPLHTKQSHLRRKGKFFKKLHKLEVYTGNRRILQKKNGDWWRRYKKTNSAKWIYQYNESEKEPKALDQAGWKTYNKPN